MNAPHPSLHVQPDAATVSRVLGVSMLAFFSTSIFIRALDPVIPPIAADLETDPATAALLATAFALPYAVVQPILGGLADVFGKTRLITVSLVALVAISIASALAVNFSMLLVLRIAAGAFAGGVFPTALALAGDLVPVNQRQVAIGRLLSAGMIGNLLGSPGTGAVADLVGWRGVFALMGAITLIALIAALIGFRNVPLAPTQVGGFAAVPKSYRDIFRNPLAKVCFGAVLVEGTCLFGLFPYVALLLHERGEVRASIAGVVMSGFGLGGIVYAVSVGFLLGRLGERGMMIGGGLTMGVSIMAMAFGPPWPLEFALFCLLGLGFYSLHGVIQVYATELLPSARGSAMSMHAAFFFMGNAIGPVSYGFNFTHAGLVPTLVGAGAILIVVGFVCSRTLRRAGRGSAAAPRA